MMELPEVSIGRGKFKVFPTKYALLFMVWYSRNSSIRLYRLSVITYISSHVIRYQYEIPPIISKSLLNDLMGLVRDGHLELLPSNGRYVLRVTDKGRHMIREFFAMGDEYVLFGDYLITKLKDLLNELSRIINAYQDMDLPSLLSIAFREESIRERDFVSDVLKDLALDLRSPCENRLG